MHRHAGRRTAARRFAGRTAMTPGRSRDSSPRVENRIGDARRIHSGSYIVRPQDVRTFQN